METNTLTGNGGNDNLNGYGGDDTLNGWGSVFMEVMGQILFTGDNDMEVKMMEEMAMIV